MKTMLLAAALALAALALPAAARADGCYICTSGSPCQQCRYGSQDTQAERKKCRDAGCKIGGTKSCSTAANVRTCRASLDLPGWRHAGYELLGLASPAR
ncbi:MAG: hypothetical protein KIT16_08820 [Rhodospirillaceae bacterium]|nr:hypothetical protein [Rhodospirillaceae bacterium]